MEELQSLLEKINRDGVKKAEDESARIIAAAKATADDLLTKARDESARIRAEGEKASSDYAARAAETVAQAARDTVLKIEASVTALLERLLLKDVNAALANPSSSVTLVTDAIRSLAGPGEIACGKELADTLKAQAAALGSFTVVTDDFQGTGFTVRLEGGRVEHAFTGETVAAELARRLRPDLAKMLRA